MVHWPRAMSEDPPLNTRGFERSVLRTVQAHAVARAAGTELSLGTKTFRCLTVAGRAKGYNWSKHFQILPRARIEPAWLPSWSRGRRDSAAPELRETWAVWASRTHTGRDG